MALYLNRGLTAGQPLLSLYSATLIQGLNKDAILHAHLVGGNGQQGGAHPTVRIESCSP